VAAHDDDRVRVDVSFNPEVLRDPRLAARIQCVLPLTEHIDRSSHGARFFESGLLGDSSSSRA
jgi:hypothetical protein